VAAGQRLAEEADGKGHADERLEVPEDGALPGSEAS
jgi:hypothetical protein